MVSRNIFLLSHAMLFDCGILRLTVRVDSSRALILPTVESQNKLVSNWGKKWPEIFGRIVNDIKLDI